MNEVNFPKTNRGQETLDKILKAAEELFSSNGYYNTSITDITQNASIAPGTFYIYFKDKKSVFCYLVEELSKTLRTAIHRSTKCCKTRYELEYIGFKTFFDFVSEHRGLYKIVWESQFVDESLFKNYYQGLAKGYIKGIKEAQKNNEIKSELDPETIVYCLMGISNFIGLRWVIWKDTSVPEYVFEDMMKFIKEGTFTKQ
ncbi:TetR/AcrR family transcriptional regulator [Clostridiisalibacter paucivorans]|uniref:TetR/AcrR family transcriptional regulator n=1 Tax=Clostridiisalibacter paucivorans TaxID=408753 RepID=UPI00047B15F9|nr:TetR/AcrR family transcriptional regulator [Clostridiisalibacter paucivorans]